jgi:hypothetical protein
MSHLSLKRSGGIRAARGGLVALLATAIIAVVGVSTSEAALVTLLDDTFADGSRAETSLPTESAVYFGIDSNASVPQGSVSVSAGALSHTLDESSTKMWTHFATDGSEVELAVGDKLIAMISFIPRDVLPSNTSRSFRVGLFNDPSTAQVLTDVNDDGGGAGDPWSDSTGYGVNIRLTSGAAQDPFDISKRVSLNSSLIGSGGAFVFSGGGGTAINQTLDTEYTLTYEIHRTSATMSNITVSLADGSGVLSTHTALDDGDLGQFAGNDTLVGNITGSESPYTTFEHLFFRYSTNTQVADRLDFTRIKVQHFQIPEPSTLLLGLASAVGAAFIARRRVR